MQNGPFSKGSEGLAGVRGLLNIFFAALGSAGSECRDKLDGIRGV